MDTDNLNSELGQSDPTDKLLSNNNSISKSRIKNYILNANKKTLSNKIYELSCCMLLSNNVASVYMGLKV